MRSEVRAQRVGIRMVGRPLRVMVCFAFVLIVISNLACAKPTEVILHAFAGPPGDGAGPDARVIRDAAGNLYGTTYYGGAYNLGMVYKLATSGHERVLHDFEGIDGLAATGGVIIDGKGDLYGTAWAGGKNEQDCNSDGCGVVFRLKPDGAFKLLYAFTGGANGDAPDAGLLERNHTFFGTTYYGGANQQGTAFALSPTGSETVIFSFDSNGGRNPTSELIMDKSGNLYGTSASGGSKGRGCVYKLAQDGTEAVLYSFSGGSDGGAPDGGLLMDKSGNLYGTTLYVGGRYVGGTVYKITPDGTETVLYAFTGGSDGGEPGGTLIADKSGNLYGITYEGGVVDYNCSPYGCGTVFKLSTDGTEKVLYAFQGGTDGADPSGLTMDSAGNLYGTTYYGGTGSGTVFEIMP